MAVLRTVRSFRSPPPPPRLTLAAVAPLQNSTTPFRLLLKTRFISSIKEKRQPLYHPTSMSHSSDDERPIGPVNSNCATSGTVEEPIELRRLPPDSNADTTYSSDDETSFRSVVSKRVTIVVDEAESCSLLPNPDADGMFQILRFLLIIPADLPLIFPQMMASASMTSERPRRELQLILKLVCLSSCHIFHNTVQCTVCAKQNCFC